MEREDQISTIVELGSVSSDTHGDDGFFWEARGTQRTGGISDD